MSQVQWPAEAVVKNLTLNPNSRPVRGVYRGFGVFRGTLEINAVDPEKARAVGVALDSLSSRLDNWAEIPSMLPTITGTHTVINITQHGCVATLGTVPEGMERGAWFRVGSKVFQAHTWDELEKQFQWVTDWPIRVNQKIEPMNRVRLRFRDPVHLNNKNGPWIINVEEYPYQN